MTCRRTRRLLPLFAGGDLPERRARRVQIHVETCADCRRELEEYQRAVRVVADAVRVTPAGDWTPGEWRAVMDRVAKEKREPRDRAAAAPAPASKWVPAFASAATVVVVVAISLLLKDSPIKTAGTQPGPGMTNQQSASKKGGPAAAAQDSSKQDVLTMTLVSPDTGLQVVWVFNRDFDWKGESN